MAAAGCFDVNLGAALFVRVEFPLLGHVLDRFARVVIGDAEEPERAGPFHTLVVERTGLEVGVNRIADAVMAPVGPDEHLERLPRDEDAPLPDDCPA